MTVTLAQTEPQARIDERLIGRLHERARAWEAKQRRQRRKRRAPMPKARLMRCLRLSELERIFRDAYGRHLPDDDAGRDDLALAVNYLVQRNDDTEAHVVRWCRVWAPWLPEVDARAMAARATANPRKYSADEIAELSGLDWLRRSRLQIKTIGAVDVDAEQRAELRKAKRREAERLRRARNSTGRPVGRPRKNTVANDTDSTIGHGINFDAKDGSTQHRVPGSDSAASPLTGRAITAFANLQRQTCDRRASALKAAKSATVTAEALIVSPRPRYRCGTVAVNGIATFPPSAQNLLRKGASSA